MGTDQWLVYLPDDLEPEPITSERGTIEIETQHGVITVENARNA